jgi:hypothetical protein
MHTNRPVLNLTPLAVTAQTVCEGEKFGIEVEKSRGGKFKNCEQVIREGGWESIAEQPSMFDTTMDQVTVVGD